MDFGPDPLLPFLKKIKVQLVKVALINGLNGVMYFGKYLYELLIVKPVGTIYQPLNKRCLI